MMATFLLTNQPWIVDPEIVIGGDGREYRAAKPREDTEWRYFTPEQFEESFVLEVER